MRFALRLTLALAMLVPASAQAQETFTSARARALSAYAGGGTANGAIFSNPAGLAMAQVYSAEFGYVMRPELATHSLGGSVADYKTNPNIAGGVGFIYELANGPSDGEMDNARGYDVRVAAALPLIPGQLTFGASGHHVRHNQNYLSAEDSDEDGELDVLVDEQRGYTADLGVMAAPFGPLRLGAALHNVVEVPEAGLWRELHTGVGVYVQRFHAEAEWSRGLETDEDTFSIGAEYLISTVPFQIGYRNGVTDTVSAGAGWRSATGGVDVLFIQDLDQTNDRQIGMSLSYYM